MRWGIDNKEQAWKEYVAQMSHHMLDSSAHQLALSLTLSTHSLEQVQMASLNVNAVMKALLKQSAPFQSEMENRRTLWKESIPSYTMLV